MLSRTSNDWRTPSGVIFIVACGLAAWIGCSGASEATQEDIQPDSDPAVESTEVSSDPAPQQPAVQASNPEIFADTTLATFLSWSEQEQQRAMEEAMIKVVTFYRREVNRTTGEPLDKETIAKHRMVANTALVLFDQDVARRVSDDPEATPRGFDELLPDMRYNAERLGDRRVVELIEHYLLIRTEELTGTATFPLDERDDEEQQQYVYRSIRFEDWNRESARIRAALDAAEKRLKEELREAWEDMRDNSIRLADGQLVFIVDDEPLLIPAEPGEPQPPTQAQRRNIWRQLRDDATTIPDGRRILIQDLASGQRIVVVVPPDASGKFLMLEGEEAIRVWRLIQNQK